MNQNQQRSAAFVHRLLSNPALNQFTPLQKEEQVAQFLQVNINQLGPTLMSSAFFPGMPLDQIRQLLVNTLVQLTNERLMPALKGIVQKIDYSFVQVIRQQQVRPASIHEQLHQFIESILAKSEGRIAFAGCYTALHYDFATNYVSEAFRMRRHIYFELTKVQRLKMSKEEVTGFVQLTLLLKAAAQSMNTGDHAETADNRNGLISSGYARKLAEQITGALPMLPPQVISSAVNANVSFIENSQVETTARLASILSTRGKSFAANIKVDRGADTPDKSWLNIARRNYKFYGFDIKMLDELYMVAAENGW